VNWTRVGYFFVVTAIVIIIGLVGPHTDSVAQTSAWSRPINISRTPNRSWFPDMAVDSNGNVHVTWCETSNIEKGGELEQVLYTVWNGYEWSELNDIVPPDPNIIRNAIATDRSNVLHMAFRYPNVAGGFGVYHTKATSGAAWSAASWSPPRLVNARGLSYTSDLAIDSQSVIHLLFDDLGDMDSEVCPGCADIFYRRSTDNGETWAPATNLSQSPIGSSHPQIEIDKAGVIHATWDEGWDRITGQGKPISSTYTFSTDGGETWASLLSLAYPITETVQLTPASDGQGGVMLAWRTVHSDTIHYQWSSNAGTTWAEPAAIPGILARPWVHEFDMYDMTTDSAGHIHLVAVGRDAASKDLTLEEAPLGVYHLEWDGSSWLPPEKIFEQEGLYPEYPKIAISGGNRLNVVWFTRDDPWRGANYEVWFSNSRSTAPRQTPMPTYTPTPSPTPQPPPSPTPTATPLFAAGSVQTSPSGAIQTRDLYTDSDEIIALAIALSPLALITAGIFIGRKMWFRK
jgi:hypothetical protein